MVIFSSIDAAGPVLWSGWTVERFKLQRKRK
jgi:hypothetical protein